MGLDDFIDLCHNGIKLYAFRPGHLKKIEHKRGEMSLMAEWLGRASQIRILVGSVLGCIVLLVKSDLNQEIEYIYLPYIQCLSRT